MPGAQNILVIMTGGTIDAEPYEQTPEFVTPLEHSLIPDMVKQLGYGEGTCDFFQWIMKDSQEFTREEMQQLADIIKADAREHFVITHGTDAMVKNARLLDEFLQDSGKTVFFVGAMEPLTHGGRSDGPENLRRAIDTIQAVGEEQNGGVFIIGRGEVANGKLGPCMFRPDEAAKDKTRKLFYSENEAGIGR